MTHVPRTTGPAVGDGAPDLVVLDASGVETGLSAFWTAAPRALVLVFLRHFG